MTSDELVASVLDRWRTGIDAHRPDDVAALFTDDAVFQGLRPYSVGRGGVATYYASQPLGMTVSYRILESRKPAVDVALGYLEATFAFTDRPPLLLHIGVTLTRDAGEWRIAQYQASKLD